MYEFKYVAVLDVDEVIMPMGNVTTWKDMLDVLEGAVNSSEDTQLTSSFVFRNMYFFNEFLNEEVNQLTLKFKYNYNFVYNFCSKNEIFLILVRFS